MGSNMQVAAKIFFTAFWLSFLTLAKNQECSKEKIDYENIQKSDLLESYPNGQNVKVKCTTGYVGLLRIECKNGKWIKIAGRDCKKRACGHPGDTPNGFFQLTKETEFVFGATVEYSCRTGYTMASRINYRNCRSNGWDNDVPVCEVLRCPILSDFGDVIASGNTEEASYNDVIYFECALNKMLDGPENIHCTENGTWSNTIPKCKEIECLSPEIPHGYTNPNIVYKENDILHYSCKEGYKTNNPSKCTRHGWTVQPGCKVKKRDCEETSVQNGSKQEFDTGRKYSYSCDKNYKAFDEKWWDVVSCTGSQWSYAPLCIPNDHCGQIPNGPAKHNQAKKGYENGATEMVGCDSQLCFYKCVRGKWEKQNYESTKCGSPPPVENAVIVSYNQDNVKYACRKNYSIKGDGFLYCTNSKWKNPPTCESEKGNCTQFSVKNGSVFELDKGFSYSCVSDYKAFDEKWWDVVTCTGSQWSYTPLCIPNDHCGQIPNGHAKQNQAKKGYENGTTEMVGCDSQLCFYKCVRGKWEKQNYESTKCGSPPPVENAVITSYNQETVKYACRENYEIKGDNLISCINSKWKKTPTCESPSPLNTDKEARPFMEQIEESSFPENVPSEQTKQQLNGKNTSTTFIMDNS
ncbi:complement factor H-like isoform X2 [Tachysurus vachellii]|uniref:complement factor H-like isoform X2 n=1 Tax=Tachysurus vachellii TaxID=175792 RepID=UPI00296A9777|nr:complement factor H-like isoform X2 [Tachysurus vachellii]